jgi:hypothetical protein
MKEIVVQDFTDPIKVLKKVRNILHSDRRLRINQAHCMEILTPLREAERIKGPELWPNVWILHHDNAPAHKALLSSTFWPKILLLKWNTDPIPLIWLRMTSGCFRK